MNDTRATAVLGAIVADAAALGLHWIYDTERIASVTKRMGSPAFVPVNPDHYRDVPAYFAHGARQNGETSQYGEALHLTLPHIGPAGFDVPGYQNAFGAHFGPGGTYRGYIDRPTRGTLDHLAAGQTAPSGVDDDQLPAISRLPAIVAYGTSADVVPAIEVTNVNAVARTYGQVFAGLLGDVIGGAGVQAALHTAAKGHSDLAAALSGDITDSTAYGAITQRACHLPMGMPLAFHILHHATSYTDAIERNILAGGDSCGRAMIIGSVMGAAHGIAGDGIPLGWILQTRAAQEVWDACHARAT